MRSRSAKPMEQIAIQGTKEELPPSQPPKGKSIDDKSHLPYSRDCPNLPAPYAAIVTSVFSIPEPMELYARIEAGIRPIKASAASMGELLDALDAAQENARLARQLLANTKATVDAVELDTNVLVSAMRDAALASLEKEKEVGTRKKAITEADVLGTVAMHFPDEWKDIQGRLSKSKLTVGYIESLCERAAERARDLRAIVGSSRGV